MPKKSVSKKSQIRALYTLQNAKDNGELDPFIIRGLTQLLVEKERPEISRALGKRVAEEGMSSAEASPLTPEPHINLYLQPDEADRTIESLALPEQTRELIKFLKLEKGYVEALTAHKAFRLTDYYSYKPIPDFRQVLQVFTHEKLKAAKDFQNPRLILTPAGSRFTTILLHLSHWQMGKDFFNAEVYSSHPYKGKISELEPKSWSAYIVEGATEVDPQKFDDIKLNTGQRLKNFKKHKETAKVGGMDRWKYAQLVMLGLLEGKPIDPLIRYVEEAPKVCRTIFDEDPALVDLWEEDLSIPEHLRDPKHQMSKWSTIIPHGNCADNRARKELSFSQRPLEVNFVFDYPNRGQEFQNEQLRFRQSVGGIIMQEKRL